MRRDPSANCVEFPLIHPLIAMPIMVVERSSSISVGRGDWWCCALGITVVRPGGKQVFSRYWNCSHGLGSQHKCCKRKSHIIIVYGRPLAQTDRGLISHGRTRNHPAFYSVLISSSNQCAMFNVDGPGWVTWTFDCGYWCGTALSYQSVIICLCKYVGWDGGHEWFLWAKYTDDELQGNNLWWISYGRGEEGARHVFATRENASSNYSSGTRSYKNIWG